MLPVQYLARVLDVPARDVPDRPIAGLVGVQPAQNAIQRDQAGPRAALETFIVGQLVSGQVKSLNKGIALVEIDGQIVAMRLPKDVAVGDTLRLRFSGHLPHPVFQLELADLAAAESPNLSSTARMLSDLMQQVPARTMPMLTPAEALLKQPTAAPAELALALRSALVRSGLFYESHLANWVVGQDSLDNLLQEPQNRFAAEAARNAPQSAAQLLLGADGVERMPNPLHALLSQQLQVLESPQFAWRGELWPGQTMEWKIRQEAEHPAGDAASPEGRDDQTGWESHIRLSLPKLGNVDVYIKLDAQHAFNIRMVPEQADTLPLLQSHQPNLVEKLSAAGCELHAVTVKNDAET